MLNSSDSSQLMGEDDAAIAFSESGNEAYKLNSNFVDESLDGMLRALKEEQACKAFFKCALSKVTKHGPITCLYFEAVSAAEILDLKEGWIAKGQNEDGIVWWADVIDIDRHELRSVAVAGNGEIQVSPGQEIQFFSPDFLSNIRNWIDNKKASGLSLPASYCQLIDDTAGVKLNSNSVNPKQVPELDQIIEKLSLRMAQRNALLLARRDFGIVWGPPGTGKTYTLGALVSAVVQSEKHKVLVLAPTNVAADNAALAIDNARKIMGDPLAPGELIRPGRPQLLELEERDHLMAWTLQLEGARFALRVSAKERRYLEGLRRASRGEKRKQLQVELATKIFDIDQIKKDRSRQMWEIACRARIIVTTLHSAINNEELLRAIEDEDIDLVLDEAGMVPRYFLARIMDMNPRKLFLFGDFKQLGPVKESKDRNNLNLIHWVGDSALQAVGLRTLEDADRMETGGALVMLTEQSRMRDELCKPVSEIFYGGRLTATNGGSSSVAICQPHSGVLVVDPDEWCEHLRSENAAYQNFDRLKNHCRNGVVTTVGVARLLLEANDRNSVLLLSPFKTQSSELQKLALNLLPDNGRWKAGTIHISQGQESDFVILSPVNPGHSWLKGDFGQEELERLICVAFSRARTQVIVVARPNEIPKSPLLWKLCNEAPIWSPHEQPGN